MPRKQLNKSKTKKTARTSPKEPLAEGIVVPLERSGRRSWRSMNDGELVEYARGIINKKGIRSRSGLKKEDNSLYYILRRKKLLDSLEFEKGRRNWTSISDEELIAHAKQIIKEKGIKNRIGLQKEDNGLYHTLRRRKLLDKLEFQVKRRSVRNWRPVSDDAIVEYAQKFINEDGIRNRIGLEKEDSGLYNILSRRKLLDKLEFEGDERAWRRYSDEKLVEYVRGIVKDKGIKSRGKLAEKDGSLYNVLLKRRLLDRLEFEEGQRDWASLSDDQLVEYAKKFIEQNGIRNRRGLEMGDVGLYAVLRKRKLLDRLEFEEAKRNWASMSDDQLVEYAKKFIEQNGIRNRGELARVDSRLYGALYKRKLLNEIGLGRKKKRRPPRFFLKMSNDELVGYAERFIEEKGIESRSGLEKEGGGLYDALRGRKLLDRLNFEELLRNWGPMSDDELVEHARRFIKEKKIKSRMGLREKDHGLYSALVRRKLMCMIKLESDERAWYRYMDDELVEYAKRFIEERGIKSSGELKKEDGGFYEALRSRKLLDRLEFEEGRRNWASMSNNELIDYAKRFIEEKGIKSRSGLGNRDHGLYKVLRKRKLLDLVFADIEKSKERQAVQDVFDALREFSG